MRRTAAVGLIVTLAAGLTAVGLVASRGTAPPAAGPRVMLTEVRTEDWDRPDGKVVKMVYADWKNTGNRPVRRVTATVVVVDADGEVVFAAEGVTIYAAPAGSAGVGPGESYVAPAGEGASLPGVAEVALSAVEITGVSD